MNEVKYTLFFILFVVGVEAQVEIKSYEQVAIDYFAINIVDSYTSLKYFVFNGDLETTTPVPYSFCMPLKEYSDYKGGEITKINPPYPQVVNRLSFLKKLLTSRKKIGQLCVFKHYPKEDNVVVVICLSTKMTDDYYNFLIDAESNQVIDYCKKTYYE